MAKTKLEDDLAAQLRLVLLNHFAANGITAYDLAKRMDVWISTAQRMLEQPRWAFSLCCQLADAFDVQVKLSVVPTAEREVDRVLEELSGAASVELGRLIANR
jgi:hypothetical protein